MKLAMKLALCTVFLTTSIAQATITATGSVDPRDPNTWTFSTNAYVGKAAIGTITVDADSDLISRCGYLGDESGATGTATISGVGSTWTTDQIMLGYSGTGQLNITDGAEVNVSF